MRKATGASRFRPSIWYNGVYKKREAILEEWERHAITG